MQIIVVIVFLAFCAFIAKAPRQVVALVMALLFAGMVLYGVVDVGKAALDRM